MCRLTRCIAGAGLTLGLIVPAFGSANFVKNKSFENGPGAGGPDPQVPADWTLFGPTVERSGQTSLSGDWSLKAFGSDPTVGAFQAVPADPGDNVSIGAQLLTLGTDQIGGDAGAGIKIEFVDDTETVLDSDQVTVLDSLSMPDMWTAGSLGPVTAPAGTVAVRFVAFFEYETQSLGSAFWDDCELTINGSGNLLSNGGFETAGVGTGFNPAGLDFWTGFGGQEKSDVIALDGTYSARVLVGEDVGDFSGLFQNLIELEAGDRLLLSAQVYNPSGTGLAGTSAAAIKLEFSPAEGIEVPAPEENLAFDETLTDDQWTLVQYSTTVPANITQARIVLLSNDTTDTNGPVYIDSAFAERSSATGVNQLLNESFEDGTSGVNGLTNWTEFRGFACEARKNAFEVPADDGLSVLKISGSCVAGVYQDIEVAPGETLTISAMFRSDSTNSYASPDAQAGVKVEWRAGNVPPQIDIGDGANNTLTSAATTDEWHEVSIDFTMPPGSAALTRYTVIVARGDATSAEVFFDDTSAVVVCANDPAGTSCDTDVTGDCVVNNQDLGVLLAAYLSQQGDSAWNPLVNFDNSGTSADRIDNVDLGELLADYLNNCQ